MKLFSSKQLNEMEKKWFLLLAPTKVTAFLLGKGATSASREFSRWLKDETFRFHNWFCSGGRGSSVVGGRGWKINFFPVRGAHKFSYTFISAVEFTVCFASFNNTTGNDGKKVDAIYTLCKKLLNAWMFARSSSTRIYAVAINFLHTLEIKTETGSILSGKIIENFPLRKVKNKFVHFNINSDYLEIIQKYVVVLFKAHSAWYFFRGLHL